MKCSSCRFYIKSKIQGNHCGCLGSKPCEAERKQDKKKKLNKRKRDKYGL